MGLHDVSKDHAQRLEPALNANDTPTQAGDSQMPFNHSTGQSSLLRQVKTGVLQVVNDGSTLTTTSIAHGLNYIPLVIASLNGSRITTAGDDVTGASLVIPNFTGATIGGGVVSFTTWIYAFADANRVYVNFLNATGNPTTKNVTYYLLQQVAGA